MQRVYSSLSRLGIFFAWRFLQIEGTFQRGSQTGKCGKFCGKSVCPGIFLPKK
jgi:hypothetical protein